MHAPASPHRVLTRVALIFGVLLAAGCLGPDERQPHTLLLHSYDDDPISGNVTIHQGAGALLQRHYALAPQQVIEEKFGPAKSGGWTILVVPDGGASFTETRQMGRGGWYLAVNFQNGSISTSTLHGD